MHACVVILMTAVFGIASAAKCIGPVWGDECVHLCQCKTAQTCTNFNGACRSCRWGKAGWNCQRNDASLFQHVTMTGSKFYVGDSVEHVEWTGEKAVDFNKDTNLRQCAFSYRLHNGPPLTMTVDLGREVDINFISLVGADYDHSLKSMVKVEVDGEACLERNLTYAPPQKEQIDCEENTKGRVIKMTSYHDMIKICELSVWECMAGTWGRGCHRQCRCKDPMEACDRITGSCRTGCPQGARGEACQEQNVALGKIAYTPHYRRSTGRVPVGYWGWLTDGFLEPEIKFCTETTFPKGSMAWVMVHIGPPDTYVRSVIIYGHKSRISRLEGLQVTVQRDDKEQLCGGLSKDDHVYLPSLTITCQRVLQGDTIKVQRHNTGDINDRDLTICEIVVWECSDGMWGDGCENECNCLDHKEVCHKMTGVCLSGCASGFYGRACQEECPSNKWGPGCVQDCHCFERNAVCRPSDGNCSLGCAPGWMGAGCSTRCPQGKYGPSCSFTCPACVNGSLCDPETGACRGCPLGHDGMKCAEQCEPGYFGRNCFLHECNCQDPDEPCDYVTGHCASGCADNSFGDNCMIINRARGEFVTVHDHTGSKVAMLNDGDTSTCHSLAPAKRGKEAFVVIQMETEVFLNRVVLIRKAEQKGGSTQRPYSIVLDDTKLCVRDVMTGDSVEFRCTQPTSGTRITVSRTDDSLDLCEIQIWECVEGMWGADCKLECNCFSEAEVCDRRTGVCPSGQCPPNFKGVSCQMQNLALWKPAQQSSIWFYDQTHAMQYPFLAVDGVLDPTPGHCAVTQGHQSAWWEVDLLKPVSVNRITMLSEQYSTYSKMHFAILVDRQVCHERHLSKKTPTLQEDIYCNSDLRGQRVRFTSEGRIRLCEVMVWECVDGTWGTDCENACKCQDRTEICDKFKGHCLAVAQSEEGNAVTMTSAQVMLTSHEARASPAVPTVIVALTAAMFAAGIHF